MPTTNDDTMLECVDCGAAFDGATALDEYNERCDPCEQKRIAKKDEDGPTDAEWLACYGPY